MLNLALNQLALEIVFSTITFLLPHVYEKQLKNDLSAEF